MPRRFRIDGHDCQRRKRPFETLPVTNGRKQNEGLRP